MVVKGGIAQNLNYIIMSSTVGVAKDSAITVRANNSKRTFTIRTESSKYRTCKFSKEEFEDNECNTSSDWKNFLRTEDFYYLIK